MQSKTNYKAQAHDDILVVENRLLLLFVPWQRNGQVSLSVKLHKTVQRFEGAEQVKNTDELACCQRSSSLFWPLHFQNVLHWSACHMYNWSASDRS